LIRGGNFMGERLREIKFRKWDFENSEMIDGDSLAFEEYAPLVTLLNQKGIMQFTGLHDMNGVPIYEGDIVRREFEIGHDVFDEASLGFIDREIEDSGYWVGVVSYRPSEGFILNKCRKYNDDDELQVKRSGVKIHSQYAQVIGNIFQNPSLLEVK
jgi:uncharacterized phage protein (TIGR01671 family)